MRFSSLVAALKSIAGGKHIEVVPTSPPLTSGCISEPVHSIRLRPNTGAPAFGPAILPRSEQHHESRQASASYLRARMFESVSHNAPRMNRKDRRRLAKQFARNEYRRMMADDSNTAAEAEPCD